MAVPLVDYIYHWIPCPFIMLKLLFSVLSAYAAPIIMMAQSRQTDQDRCRANEDYRINLEARQKIEELRTPGQGSKTVG